MPSISVEEKRDGTDIEHGETSQDRTELFVERILGELDLAHIEIADSTDLEVFVDDLDARKISPSRPNHPPRMQGVQKRTHTVGVFR